MRESRRRKEIDATLGARAQAIEKLPKFVFEKGESLRREKVRLWRISSLRYLNGPPDTKLPTTTTTITVAKPERNREI